MAALHPSDEIIAWSQKQPRWRQDALRRLVLGTFTVKDEDDVLAILKQEYGATDEAPESVPIARDHLSTPTDDPNRISLLSIDRVSNVNRLIEGASLTFSRIGITLIYGDNGRGKTGFVRILKRACSSRHIERVLPDVFDNNRNVATARFSILRGGPHAESVQWIDNTEVSGEILRRIGIFDSKSANIHVDGENHVTVIPHNIDCFEKLARLSDRLRDRLNAEIAALRREMTPILPNVGQGNSAALLLANLGEKSKSDVNRLCVWANADDERLKEVSSLLKDPAAEAARFSRILDLLVSHKAMLEAAEVALSIGKLTALADLGREAKRALQLHWLQAMLFSSEPLGGVGDDPWRLLFEAAKAYSLGNAYPGESFPVTRENSRCVLCQQELSEPSAIPSFFRRPKCNRRLALRCDDFRMTSPEARVRGSLLSRKRSRDAQCGTFGPSVRPL